jgi:hypothetical protein
MRGYLGARGRPEMGNARGIDVRERKRERVRREREIEGRRKENDKNDTKK